MLNNSEERLHTCRRFFRALTAVFLLRGSAGLVGDKIDSVYLVGSSVNTNLRLSDIPVRSK